MPPGSGRLAPLSLDARRSTPVYLQIFRQVQQRVTAGRLRPGDRLPTVRELARQLDVNFNTVARAYRLLHTAGLVSAQQGRGTFVIARSSDPAARRLSLQALTSSYIAEARRQNFDALQITAMVARLLRGAPRPRTTGDSHG